jgi:pilus assembly protein FimV
MGATVPEGSGSDALRQELMMALEISEAQRNENEALKERMSDLQKQLDALKRLVTLKDGDLAQIQQQFAESRDMAESMPVVEAPVAAALVEPITEELPEVVTTTTEQAPSSLVIPDEPVVEETIADALMQEQKSAVVVAPEVTTPKVAPLPKPIPAPIIKPAAEPDFISSVISDPMFMTAGGATLALILLLLLLMIKKRGNRFHESILSGDASSMGASTIGGPDTSFLSDLAISGLAGGGMESDEGEVDPLTEADVYMAYGRTKQAESLLKDALKSNPDRLELKSKLLEVYFTAKDKDKFDAIIADSSEQLQKDDAAWKKILIMGHELSPENLLFAEAPEEDGAEDDLLDFAEGDDTVFDDVLDIGIDLDELSAEMESASGDDLDFDLGLDFSDLDNDIFSTSSESADKKSADSQTEDEESFDLSELDIDGAQEEVLDTPLAAIEASDETADDGGLDFNLEEFELDDSSTTNKQSGKSVLAATTGPDDDSGIDFTLDDLDLESADESDLSAELDDELSSIDGDLDDIGDLSDLTGDEDLADVGDLSDLSIDIEDDDLDSIDLELLDAAEADETDAVSEEQAIELDTSDLDLLADDEASEISDAPITADSLDIDTDKPEKSGELVIDDDSMDLDDFDFDFDSVQSDEIDEVVQSAVELDSDIGLELSDSDESTAETTDELDDFDLEFDIADDDSLDADGFDELDLDVDDIELDTNDGDMDTKIDLAKAYIEMGDADGARHMLDEVVSQGDASQKQQAQDLLDSI